MIFLLCLLPLDVLPIYKMDSVEVNSVIDCEGNVYLQQVIFWRYDERFQKCCEGWKMAKDVKIDGTTVRWQGGKVRANNVDHTLTDHDPELENRNFYPVGERRIK